MTPNVVIAAITAYQGVEETRFRLAKEMIKNAIKAGYHVILIDESANGVWGVLREVGANVYAPSEKGMGNARRESVRKAEFYAIKNFSDSESIIIMTEPEKSDLIRWIPNLIAPIVEGRADIVLPRRNKESWESYPRFQRESEKFANLVYYEMTGIKADPMFGSVAFHQKFSEYFTNCYPFDRYGVPDNYIHHVAPIEAFSKGCKIEVVEIGFIYPPEQKTEEEGPKLMEMLKKRIDQQNQLSITYFEVSKALQLPTIDICR